MTWHHTLDLQRCTAPVYSRACGRPPTTVLVNGRGTITSACLRCASGVLNRKAHLVPRSVSLPLVESAFRLAGIAAAMQLLGPAVKRLNVVDRT